MAQEFSDPLKEILERHIIRASTEGQNSTHVVEAILVDYVKLLTSQGVNIPFSVKNYFLEDLREEIKELIVKRTFAAVPVEPPTVSTEYTPTRKIS